MGEDERSERPRAAALWQVTLRILPRVGWRVVGFLRGGAWFLKDPLVAAWLRSVQVWKGTQQGWPPGTESAGCCNRGWCLWLGWKKPGVGMEKWSVS